MVATSNKMPCEDLTRKRLKTTCAELVPRDVLEIILSRLPIKSILRFKAVPKAWNDLILDRRLARIHLHSVYYDTKGDRNLFMCSSHDTNKHRLLKFKGSKLDVVSDLRFPRATANSSPRLISGSCDGFFLLYDSCDETYVLWNPITGSNTLFATYPYYPTGCNYFTHGICYDSLNNDYKVVYITPKWYTAYSCRDGSWTESREFPYDGVKKKNVGATVRGVLYWVFFYPNPSIDPPTDTNISFRGHRSFIPLRFRGHSRDHSRYETDDYRAQEIVYFDATDCGLRTLQGPEELRANDVIHLTNLNGRLCLYQKSCDCSRMRIWVLVHEENNNAHWTKLMDVQNLPRLKGYPDEIKPLYLTEDHSRIVLQVLDLLKKPRFIVYDIRNQTSELAWTLDDDGMDSEVVAGLGSLVLPACIKDHS